MHAALSMAKTIASKSPVAVQGTKMNLNFARDHTVDEGLEYIVSVDVECFCFLIIFLESLEHVAIAIGGHDVGRDERRPT